MQAVQALHAQENFELTLENTEARPSLTHLHALSSPSPCLAQEAVVKHQTLLKCICGWNVFKVCTLTGGPESHGGSLNTPPIFMLIKRCRDHGLRFVDVGAPYLILVLVAVLFKIPVRPKPPFPCSLCKCFDDSCKCIGVPHREGAGARREVADNSRGGPRAEPPAARHAEVADCRSRHHGL